jgi:tetratricopeptide (TPR) repeat protein
MSQPPIIGVGAELPVFEGPPTTRLPADAPETVEALRRAAEQGDRGEALRSVAARWPGSVEVWARLGESAYQQQRDVEAFAYFRTAYHRGLDQLRRNGWRGVGLVPWSHEPNRGVLLAIRGLMLASARLGELEEALRCQKLLLDSDPSDPLRVGGLTPEDLENRPEL